MGRKLAFAAVAAFVAVLLIVLLLAKSGSENKKISLCRSDGCKVTGESMVRFLSRDNDPCTDFYDYACGKYIFLDKPRNHSVLSELTQNVKNQVKTLLGSSLVRSPTPVQLAATFYKNCRDAAPYYAAKWLEEELVDIGGWPLAASSEDVVEEPTEEEDDLSPRNWTDSYVKTRSDWKKNWIIGINVVLHSKNKSKYIIKIELPEKDSMMNFLMKESNSTDNQAKVNDYKAKIKNTADKMGRKRDAVDGKLVDELVDFEKKLAIAYKKATKSKKEEKYVTLKELTDSDPDSSIPWDKIIHDVFHQVNITIGENEQILFTHKEYYKKLSEIIKETNEKAINSYIGWKFIQHFGGELDQLPKTDDAREEYCLQKTFKYFSHALKRMYIEKYFDSASRIRADSIIQTVKKYIMNTPKALMMSEKDRDMRSRIKKKIESVTSVIGYEDWMAKRDKIEEYYSNIPDYLDRKFLGNIIDVTVGQSYKELRKLRQKYQAPVRDPDVPSVLRLDAFYEQENSRLVYSPGFLQAPIFTVDAPLPINFGSFGSWVACDLVYSFNHNGSMINENKAKRKWWTTKAETIYKDSIRCFDDVYDPIIGLNNRSLDEVVATVEGLRLSFETFTDIVSKSRDVRIPKHVKSLSLEQIFFVAFAQTYCSNDKYERVPVNTIVMNYPPFLDAFKCKKSPRLRTCRL